MSFRIVPIDHAVAAAVRRTGKAPGYGHPAYRDTATGYGPCRSCLQLLEIGAEARILFTYDPFSDLERLPLPGPIYVHERDCAPYQSVVAFPEALRSIPITLNAYAVGRHLRQVLHVEPGGDHESVIRRLFDRDDVDYLHARNTEAGCYLFRVELTEE
jgi:hypothetical protein